MVQRERVTLAVMVVLIAVGAWFANTVFDRGLAESTGGAMLKATIAIAILTTVLAGFAAALGAGKGKEIDERDSRIALRSQVVRGFFYLCLTFGVLGLAVSDGNFVLANGLFLAVLAIEITSGAVMLALYRVSA
ncbi:MAG: hypothetical protein AAGH41_04535 [Pseudomonadota bacterium]